MHVQSTIVAFYIKNSALSKLLKTYPFLSVSIENGTVATGGINDAWSIESIVRHPNNFSSVTQWLLYLLSNHIHIFDIDSKNIAPYNNFAVLRKTFCNRLRLELYC